MLERFIEVYTIQYCALPQETKGSRRRSTVQGHKEFTYHPLGWFRMITGNQSVRQALVSQNLSHSLVMSLVQEIKHCSVKRHFICGHISCKGAEEDKSCEGLHFSFKMCVYYTAVRRNECALNNINNFAVKQMSCQTCELC